MDRYFESLPTWVTLPIVVFGVACLAVWCSWMVRKRHPVEVLVENNEIAGFKFGVVGVLYAVMLGMAVVAVWEDYKDAGTNTAQEASLVGDLYRDAGGLNPVSAVPIRRQLLDYAKNVVNKEWDLLAVAERDPDTQQSFEELFALTLKVEPSNAREQIVLAEFFSGLNKLADARRQRLFDARETMPGILWLTLIVGGSITISFTFFFGNRNWAFHRLMTGMLAGLIAMLVFVIHEIDHPFSGSARLEPLAMQHVVDRLTGLEAAAKS